MSILVANKSTTFYGFVLTPNTRSLGALGGTN